MSIKVSVIVATYNDVNVEASISSLLNQTYIDYEIILINDQPKNKKSIEDKFGKFEKVKIFHNNINIGLTKSLNKAILYTQGDIIVRHDADDISLPNRIEKIVSFFNIHTEVDIIASYAYMFFDNFDLHDISTYAILKSPINHLAITKQLLKSNCLIHPSLAFRKEILVQVVGYNPYFRYAQDYELYLRIMRLGLVFEVIPEPLIAKHYSEDNITVAKRKQQLFYSLAAQSLHFAHNDFRAIYLFYILTTIFKLLVPNTLRTIKNRIFK